MSAYLSRAELLLQQSRHAEAEKEATLALAENSENAQAHAVLALCRMGLGRSSEAVESARRAIGLSPEEPYFHYVHGVVLHDMDRFDDAMQAANAAITLDPADANWYSLRASVHLAKGDWKAALADADAGLALDAENVGLANLRSIALLQLGRRSEAAIATEGVLNRSPENAMSHANQGWRCLHENDPRRAQEHFREALRLEPDLEFARRGMLEALKARNPIYRVMLAYFLWMGRQSSRIQWAFIIFTIVVVRIVRQAAMANPSLGLVLWPLVVLFYAFIYLSWTAQPVFNLLLRFDRFGRYVLSREERNASNWYGASLLLIPATGIWWSFDRGIAPLFALISSVMFTVCVAASFSRKGRNRLIVGAASGVLALVGIVATVVTVNSGNPVLFVGFFLGFLGFQFLANAFAD